MKKPYLGLLIIFLLTVLALGVVKAQEQPAPAVGRVSLIDGDVLVQRAGSGEWVAAGLNATVDRGDSLSTGERSRAEIELDYANLMRLDQHAEVAIADLTRDRIQLQVTQGLVNYTVFNNGAQAQVEIDTPNMAVHPLGPGVYRIQVDSPSETSITVREGEVEVSTPQGSNSVKAGETSEVRGTDNPEYRIVSAPGRDGWDEWNQQRDRTIYQAQSWSHTNRHYTGSENLDRYGHWRKVRGYGDAWAPAGPRIERAAGPGTPTMAGPGSPTSRGAGRPITMVAGFGMTMRMSGSGGRAPSTPRTTRCGHRPG